MVSRTRGDVWVLAGASAASNTGNWAASVALALVVFAKTGSTVWLSASFLFTQVPSALVAPLSGMMVDRLDRKRIMITCDLLGAAVYLGMAVTGQPLLLIVLGSVAALLHAPFGPSAQAAVPNLAGGGRPGVGQWHAGGRVERGAAGWPGGRRGALRGCRCRAC
jgi:MFS family permease